MPSLWDYLDDVCLLLLSFRRPPSGGGEPPSTPSEPGFAVGTRIGRAAGEEGTLVLTEKETSSSIYVIGSSGSGKSTFLTNLIDYEVGRCR